MSIGSSSQVFYAVRRNSHLYPAFGAEAIFYSIRVFEPTPHFTIKDEEWRHFDPPPAPLVARSSLPWADAIWKVGFHPDYGANILSDYVAAQFAAKVNDWILVSLTDGRSVHPFYVQVNRIKKLGDCGYNRKLFRVSDLAIKHEFQFTHWPRDCGGMPYLEFRPKPFCRKGSLNGSPDSSFRTSSWFRRSLLRWFQPLPRPREGG